MLSIEVMDMPVVKGIISSAEYKIKKLTGIDITLVPAGLKSTSVRNNKLLLQQLTETFFETSWRNIISKRRTLMLVQARWFYAYAAVKVLQQTYALTGDELGNRDHATILNAITRCKKHLAENDSTGIQLNDFIKQFNKLIQGEDISSAPRAIIE